MTKKISPINNWLGYSGNKRKQIEGLMPLVPKRTETFVDLFGGTGIVGLNAYHYNRCKRVVYNDLEYDIMLTLKQLHDLTGDEVVSGYKWAYKTNECHPPNEEGLVANDIFKKDYLRMMEDYNKERTIAWDYERKETDFESLMQRVFGLITAYVKVDYLDGEFSKHIPLAHLKKRYDEGLDIQNPFEFLFLAKHSYLQTPHLTQNGRIFRDSPRLGNRKKPYVNVYKGIEEIREFFDAWHKTPVEFFSHDFTEGWLGMRQHERPRVKIMQERWNEMLSSLTPRDFVFIDPPYHGSKAGYNAKWKLSMEIYLMAFCQQLDERKIPFLITNNLGWNRTIFVEWTRLPHLHTYLWGEEAAKSIYSGKADKNRYEVYVSNYCFPASKYQLPEGLMEVVLHERSEDELPAEIRYVEKTRGETYRARKKKAQTAKKWKPEIESK